jgi:TM2 domain-containing membrane protein YozV
MSDAWFYVNGEQTVGPVTLEALLTELSPKDWRNVFVWKAGFSDWKKASDVAELRDRFQIPPPLPQSGGKNQKDTLSSSEKYCSQCGSIINARAEICPDCGVRQFSVPFTPPTGRSRVAAALFALLLGGLGVHKFYLGRVGQGILYLVFCWTFIPAIIGFIEGLVYLTMSDQDFYAKYG